MSLYYGIVVLAPMLDRLLMAEPIHGSSDVSANRYLCDPPRRQPLHAQWDVDWGKRGAQSVAIATANQSAGTRGRIAQRSSKSLW